MSELLGTVRRLVANGDVRVSRHGLRELFSDDILLADAVAGLSTATVVEEYPAYEKGPCVLVLERDGANRPIHVLWGMVKNNRGPAVLITAYRPDPKRWTSDFTKRVRS